MEFSTRKHRTPDGYVEYVTTFTGLPRGVPDVTICLPTSEFEGQPQNTAFSTTGVREVRVTQTASADITDESLRRVAKRLPVLMSIATQASHPDVTGLDLVASDVGRETLEAARIVREAVERHDNPLQAVQQALNVSKATASRRVRAAKDAGLLPDKLGELR